MSNGIASYILTFSAGAAIGSLVAWRVLKARYETIANEEIASVKEVFSKRFRNNEKKNSDKVSVNAKEATVKNYADVVRDSGYVDYSDVKNTGKGGTELKTSNEPYVIAPESFGEYDDYETDTLTYYADGVLADDCDNPVYDVEGTVGEDAVEHFGEYEDDAVFVRNEERRIDYEILRDTRNYADVVGSSPYNSEDE